MHCPISYHESVKNDHLYGHWFIMEDSTSFFPIQGCIGTNDAYETFSKRFNRDRQTNKQTIGPEKSVCELEDASLQLLAT